MSIRIRGRETQSKTAGCPTPLRIALLTRLEGTDGLDDAGDHAALFLDLAVTAKQLGCGSSSVS